MNVVTDGVLILIFQVKKVSSRQTNRKFIGRIVLVHSLVRITAIVYGFYSLFLIGSYIIEYFRFIYLR